MSKTYHPGETVTGRYVVMRMIIIVNEEDDAYEDDDGDTDMMNFSHDNDERVHISTKSVFKYEGVELFLEGLVGLHHQHLPLIICISIRIISTFSITSIFFIIITTVFKVHTHKSAAMLDNLAYVAAKPTILISHSLNLAKAGKCVFAIA